VFLLFFLNLEDIFLASIQYAFQTLETAIPTKFLTLFDTKSYY